MIRILREKATKQDLVDLQERYEDYIKVVIDLQREVMAAGGEYHVDCEQVLIKDGSKQSDLWGGGYTVSTGGVDFMALSNYRPADGRVTYEIADEKVQKKFKEIVEKTFN
ncbi:hypothetical protein KKB83_02255 [Patescibacteria group bacterium]|nr:hypothetical protein [Patescibacteria group bacterium]